MSGPGLYDPTSIATFTFTNIQRGLMKLAIFLTRFLRRVIYKHFKVTLKKTETKRKTVVLLVTSKQLILLGDFWDLRPFKPLSKWQHSSY